MIFFGTIQRILKNVSLFSAKVLRSTRDVNIDDKSAYYYDFWRSCDTEDWSNDAENTDLITEINYSLTHIHIENSYSKL